MNWGSIPRMTKSNGERFAELFGQTASQQRIKVSPIEHLSWEERPLDSRGVPTKAALFADLFGENGYMVYR